MKCALRFVIVTALFLAATTAAVAQDGDSGPCAYDKIDVNKWGHKPFQNPPEISSVDGILKTTLEVKYTDPQTTSIAGCKVTLRSYNGQLVGPTLRAKPGDVLAIRLANHLPKESPDTIEEQYLNEAQSAHLGTRPNGFNVTNLHTHGLHVSPAGNSDNVLLAIQPGDTFPYEIKLPLVPAPHPAGSFWYHAHAHGSTAIQVGSAMAGALIVADDESKIPPALRAANLGEKILVFQTILYDTEGKLDNITKLFPGPQNPTTCECSKQQHPENYGTWPCANRLITINGQIVPEVHMKPGEVQRWRLIDAAYRQSIFLAIVGHEMHEIALDGIYTGKIDTYPACPAQGCTQYVDLEPGYRSDILVKASSRPGHYAVLSLPGTPAKSLRGTIQPQEVLAELVVDNVAPVNMSLPTAAEMAKLNPFPGVDLSKIATGVQEAAFKLGSDLVKGSDQPDPCGTNANPLSAFSRAAANAILAPAHLMAAIPTPPAPRIYFQVNYRSFNPSHVRTLKLNSVDQWRLASVGDPKGQPNAIPPVEHVFHIHVNPFQYTRQGPDGQNEMVWKDTLAIPAGGTLNIYTKYTDYIGQFVMHCHILDHEDLGMMEVEEVVDESSGVATHTH